jgi:hypothetical protein
MYSVLNCHNAARHIEFYLEELWFNATSTGNAGYFKKTKELNASTTAAPSTSRRQLNRCGA